MWCSGLVSAARDIVLVAHLPSVLVRRVMLVVLGMERVLLFRDGVHARKPLVVLPAIHHVLTLITILGIPSEVVDHGSAQRGPRRRRGVVRKGSSLAVRRGCAVMVATVVLRVERPTTRMEPVWTICHLT